MDYRSCVKVELPKYVLECPDLRVYMHFYVTLLHLDRILEKSMNFNQDSLLIHFYL